MQNTVEHRKEIRQKVNKIANEKMKPLNENNRHSNLSNSNESTFSSQHPGVLRVESPHMKKKNKENGMQLPVNQFLNLPPKFSPVYES